ncbi:MAG: hypothetical protein IH602_14960 [Bryobacteraceae bacterium]|nr:hypothetical protein [Bryobacteraceae bacterium]
MKEQNKKTDSAPTRTRKGYKRPGVRDYGRLSRMTQGGAGSKGEQNDSQKFKRP